MNKYIGFKMNEAEPMTRGDYNHFKGWTIPVDENPNDEGYLVKYSDDYISWSPKDVFEKAYMQISDKNTITHENVTGFVKNFEVTQMGDKTTIVKAELVNGFIIIESSSCVDPANFDEIVGRDICKERIYNKIWELLGFLLQTAKEGII